MIKQSLTRLMHVWTTIGVITLHGMAVWASISIESPKRSEIQPQNSQPIQIELLTLNPQESLAPHTNQTQPNVQQTLESATKVLETPLSVEESTRTETDKKQPILPTALDIKNRQKINAKSSLSNSSTAFNLDNEVNKSKAKNQSSTSDNESVTDNRQALDSTEEDLAAMIREMTKQYNLEQAEQRRAMNRQDIQKRKDQKQWQDQADYEAMTQLLALATAQAEKLKAAQEEQNLVNNDEKDKNNAIPFLENQGSWLNEQPPLTGMSSLLWQNIDIRSGDLFIVLLELQVDIQGYITGVKVLETSGSPTIDAVASTQVRAGQLNPLELEGVPVNAVIPMSLVYERP